MFFIIFSVEIVWSAQHSPFQILFFYSYKHKYTRTHKTLWYEVCFFTAVLYVLPRCFGACSCYDEKLKSICYCCWKFVFFFCIFIFRFHFVYSFVQSIQFIRIKYERLIHHRQSEFARKTGWNSWCKRAQSHTLKQKNDI